jgi:hypothetical protein
VRYTHPVWPAIAEAIDAAPTVEDAVTAQNIISPKEILGVPVIVHNAKPWNARSGNGNYAVCLLETPKGLRVFFASEIAGRRVVALDRCQALPLPMRLIAVRTGNNRTAYRFEHVCDS